MTLEFHCSFGWIAAVNRRLVIILCDSACQWGLLQKHMDQTDAAGYHGCLRSSGLFQDQYQSQYEITTQTDSLYRGMKPKHHTNAAVLGVFLSSLWTHRQVIISSSKCQRGGRCFMPVCKRHHMKSHENSDCVPQWQQLEIPSNQSLYIWTSFNSLCLKMTPLGNQ